MQPVTFTITPSDPFSKFMLPVPETLSSDGVEVLGPRKENTFPRRQSKRGPRSMTVTDHFGLLIPGT